MINREILLVEDNPDDETLTVRALKKTKIVSKVVVAHDGVEALDYLFGMGAYDDRDKSQLPALVVLDLKLPKLDGLEVLKRIRSNEKTRLLPVVILTSSREEQDILRGYRDGANSYVTKPVDFSQFSQAVGQLGIYWLMVNEPPP